MLQPVVPSNARSIYFSRGSTDIDAGCDDHGWTPLVLAADTGYLRVIRTLPKWGADVSAKTVNGHTALHNLVRNKHLAVTKALIKAGADLEAKTNCGVVGPKMIQGHTPLHLAAAEGFCEGIVASIDAGANIDRRMNEGSTPLYLPACLGRLEAVRVFHHAKANCQSGAHEGDEEALEAAAHMNHEDIVTLLCDFGVVDKAGLALCAASEGCAEACVRLLMRRRGGHEDIDARSYNNIANCRESLLRDTFDLGRFNAPRIARMLLDPGADTTSKVPSKLDDSTKAIDTPPVAATMALHHAKNDENVDDEKVDGSKGVMRLLRQVEIVHAKSWSWPDTSVVREVPVGKRTAGRPKMLAAAMARCTDSQDGAFLGYGLEEEDKEC